MGENQYCLKINKQKLARLRIRHLSRLWASRCWQSWSGSSPPCLKSWSLLSWGSGRGPSSQRFSAGRCSSRWKRSCTPSHRCSGSPSRSDWTGPCRETCLPEGPNSGKCWSGPQRRESAPPRGALTTEMHRNCMWTTDSELSVERTPGGLPYQKAEVFDSEQGGFSGTSDHFTHRVCLWGRRRKKEGNTQHEEMHPGKQNHLLANVIT